MYFAGFAVATATRQSAAAVAADSDGKMRSPRQADESYFLVVVFFAAARVLNFSTRPAVSMVFDWPV